MNHTCSAVAARRQTQPDAGSLLCPTPLAPLRSCLWVSFPEVLLLGLLWSPGLGCSQGREAPADALGIVPRVRVLRVAAAVSL